MPAYATESDLAAELDDLPDNAGRLLAHASRQVAWVCRCDLYDTLPNGLPADDDKRLAMRDATCVQVAEWITAGINPVAGASGQTGVVAASGIGGASVTYTAPDVAAKGRAATMLGAAALAVLRDAGLASAAVGSR